MAMRIAPPSGHAATHSHLTHKSLGAPSAPGLHDTIRAGVGPVVSSSDTTTLPDSTHPLETRLKAWEGTQESLKMEGLRRTFGLSEPIRRGMELKIAREGDWRPAVLGGTGRGMHEDILMGREASIEWEDVFLGGVELRGERGVQGFHEEVERKVRMQ